MFQWLAGNSSKRLDIIAQYWELLAAPDDPRSRDYGYSKANMQEFGAKEGYDVYKAIENAADRNVNVRYGFFFFFFFFFFLILFLNLVCLCYKSHNGLLVSELFCKLDKRNKMMM